jgi:1,4-alpha-glucan branching enzyme
MAFSVRAAELELLRAAEKADATAVRQLLALQASDWPFMVSRDIAEPYARERFAGHRSALAAALRDGGQDPRGVAAVRNLAPDVEPGLLLMPL